MKVFIIYGVASLLLARKKPLALAFSVKKAQKNFFVFLFGQIFYYRSFLPYKI